MHLYSKCRRSGDVDGSVVTFSCNEVVCLSTGGIRFSEIPAQASESVSQHR